ncbi:hypothetical protein HKX48_005099 [Thoreauomyces humboldtii]|nr:hypothetical protein HKX48_005099 [Thoreauomyces humboldtii]
MLTELLVNSRGSFSFTDGNSYRYEFAEWVLRVEKLSRHVARVWFTDHQGNPVPVPANTFLLDEDGSLHNDHAGSFFVTWIGHHQIMHNGVNVFATDNRKQVSVHSSCLHWEVRAPAAAIYLPVEATRLHGNLFLIVCGEDIDAIVHDLDGVAEAVDDLDNDEEEEE